MINKNIIKNVTLCIGGIVLTLFSLRSYGEQKYLDGYITGCEVILEAQTKKTEEKKKLY